uniref:Uncharacterized protein n=1 Tax=Timema bartmani TaxID=61472 RepID=A0A7R9F1T5_9NEOP|nr:unnamed protein product [Timema bartmani]
MATWPKDVGIVALELLVPSLYVDQAQLEEFDGVSAGKYTIGFGQSKMGFCTDREDIISLCLTVVSKLMVRYNIDYSNIGRLEVGTETIVDKSKSVKSKAIQVDSGKEAIQLKHLDAMLFHSPYCKLVQKSLARLVLNDYVLTPKNELAAKFPGLEDFAQPMLEGRKAVNPLEFSQIMEVREKNHHKAPYTPQSSPDTLFPGTWYLDYIERQTPSLLPEDPAC